MGVDDLSHGWTLLVIRCGERDAAGVGLDFVD